MCPKPALIATTLPARPWTATGTVRWIVVPSPSIPERPSPQHVAPPVLVTAQVCVEPVAICRTSDARPETWAGTDVEVEAVLPFPSSPCAFAPQHMTEDAAVSAHVWPNPELTARTPLPRPVTATGVLLCWVVA